MQKTSSACGLKRSSCNNLTGFKKVDWDHIFSVWQSCQYRAPVIKPLPVKHPAIIDEFPQGRVKLSLGLEGQEKGISKCGTSAGELGFNL